MGTLGQRVRGKNSRRRYSPGCPLPLGCVHLASPFRELASSEPREEAEDRADETIFLNLEKPLTSNPDKLLPDQPAGRNHVGHYQLDLPSLLLGEAAGDAEVSPIYDFLRPQPTWRPGRSV
ncbi:MAG: hypothetical protein QOE73_2503 [Verrucomicrobiota bacterium]